MAGNEHEAQQVVVDGFIEGTFDHGVEVWRGVGKLVFDLEGERFLLARVQFAPADHVDRAVLGSGREPGRRIFRHSMDGPLLQRRQQGVLREFLRQPHIAQYSRKRSDDFRRFDSPDRFDGPMHLRGAHPSRSAAVR
jgi:hypothetical protein